MSAAHYINLLLIPLAEQTSAQALVKMSFNRFFFV